MSFKYVILMGTVVYNAGDVYVETETELIVDGFSLPRAWLPPYTIEWLDIPTEYSCSQYTYENGVFILHYTEEQKEAFRQGWRNEITALETPSKLSTEFRRYFLVLLNREVDPSTETLALKNKLQTVETAILVLLAKIEALV